MDNDAPVKQRWIPEFSQSVEAFKSPAPQRGSQEGYYGIPMLKRPTWSWHVVLYFFLEGISAGAYLMGAVAELAGDHRFEPLIKRAHYVSLATLLPCPPFLIADLGRPDRFHHMLRVFKPSSPMNLGAWSQLGFGACIGLWTAAEIAQQTGLLARPTRGPTRFLSRELVSALGIPFALIMACYPGVLLSMTSTPLWSRSRWLGALFACTSMGTGAAAVSLALAVRGEHLHALRTLQRIERLSTVCGALALMAYLLTSGKAAHPLTRGRHRWPLVGAVGAGLVLPMLLLRAGRRKKKQSKLWTILGAAATLLGGLALKWTITHAGGASAEDTAAVREATQPTRDAPGWNPANKIIR